MTTVMLPAEYVGAGGLPKRRRSSLGRADDAAEQEPASAVTRVVLDNGTVLLHKQIRPRRWSRSSSTPPGV